MFDDAVTFDKDGAARIVRAVERVENTRREDVTPRRRRAESNKHYGMTAWARITSTSQTDDRYPAIIRQYDPALKSWSDLSNSECWLVEPNGSSLEIGTEYMVRLQGEHTDDKLIWITVGKSSGTIEVAEGDGSPILYGVTRLVFDDNFIVSGVGSHAIINYAQDYLTVRDTNGVPLGLPDPYEVAGLEFDRTTGLYFSGITGPDVIGSSDSDWAVIGALPCGRNQWGVISTEDGQEIKGTKHLINGLRGNIDRGILITNILDSDSFVWRSDGGQFIIAGDTGHVSWHATDPYTEASGSTDTFQVHSLVWQYYNSKRFRMIYGVHQDFGQNLRQGFSAVYTESAPQIPGDPFSSGEAAPGFGVDQTNYFFWASGVGRYAIIRPNGESGYGEDAIIDIGGWRHRFKGGLYVGLELSPTLPGQGGGSGGDRILGGDPGNPELQSFRDPNGVSLAANYTTTQFFTGSVSVSLPGSWDDTGIEVELPMAGRWLLIGTLRGHLTMTAGNVGSLKARLYNVTDAEVVPDSEVVVVEAGDKKVGASSVLIRHLQINKPITIKVQQQQPINAASGTLVSDGDGRSTLDGFITTFEDIPMSDLIRFAGAVTTANTNFDDPSSGSFVELAAGEANYIKHSFYATIQPVEDFAKSTISFFLQTSGGYFLVGQIEVNPNAATNPSDRSFPQFVWRPDPRAVVLNNTTDKLHVTTQQSKKFKIVGSYTKTATS